MNYETRIMIVPVTVLVDPEGTAIVDTPWTLMDPEAPSLSVSEPHLTQYFLPHPYPDAGDTAEDLMKIGVKLVALIGGMELLEDDDDS